MQMKTNAIRYTSEYKLQAFLFGVVDSDIRVYPSLQER